MAIERTLAPDASTPGKTKENRPVRAITNPVVESAEPLSAMLDAPYARPVPHFPDACAAWMT
jgi:hypothetical protein